MGFHKKVNNTITTGSHEIHSKATKNRQRVLEKNGAESKSHHHKKNNWRHKLSHGASKVGKVSKRQVGHLGKYAHNQLNTITQPLNNLTSSPTMLILLIGLGAFVVLKLKN